MNSQYLGFSLVALLILSHTINCGDLSGVASSEEHVKSESKEKRDKEGVTSTSKQVILKEKSLQHFPLEVKITEESEHRILPKLVYKNNSLVEEKFNITIDYIEETLPLLNEKINKLHSSGDEISAINLTQQMNKLKMSISAAKEDLESNSDSAHAHLNAAIGETIIAEAMSEKKLSNIEKLKEEELKLEEIANKSRNEAINLNDSEGPLFSMVEDDSLSDSTVFVQKLRKANLIDSVRTFKSFTPDSAFAKKVYIIKEKSGEEKVAKSFIEENKYTEESSQLTEEKNIVNDLNKIRETYGAKLPIIVDFKGNTMIDGVGVTVTSLAKGKSIDKLEEELNSMSDEQIIKIFTKIGAQLGALDYYYYTQGNKQLYHPDSHFGNMFYDDIHEQLYWIDYAGMDILDLENDKPKLSEFKLISNLTYPVYRRPKADNKSQFEYYDSMIYKLSSEEIKLIISSIKKHLLVLKSLYTGYASEMIGSKLKDSVIADYTYLLIEKGWPGLPRFKNQINTAINNINNMVPQEDHINLDDYHID